MGRYRESIACVHAAKIPRRAPSSHLRVYYLVAPRQHFPLSLRLHTVYRPHNKIYDEEAPAKAYVKASNLRRDRCCGAGPRRL
mgnify:FL=1